jgi:cyclase
MRPIHNIRLIARLDIKGERLIKSIQLEGVRVVGEPAAAARLYAEQGADEVLLMDAVASLYGRNHLFELICRVSEHVFLPITVGGGIRKLDDVDAMLRAGADKVAINTAAVRNAGLVTEISRCFGSQCVVAQIDAKRQPSGDYEAYVDGGREPTGWKAVDWAREVVARGAGEILLTSIDREGTRKGFDIELVRAVSDAVPVPLIASGGMRCAEDFVKVVREGHAEAVAMADILHVQKRSVGELKAEIAASGIPVRRT